jgi:hypothetical protein
MKSISSFILFATTREKRISLSCTNVEKLIKESSSSYLGAFIDEPSRANRLGRVVQQHWP